MLSKNILFPQFVQWQNPEFHSTNESKSAGKEQWKYHKSQILLHMLKFKVIRQKNSFFYYQGEKKMLLYCFIKTDGQNEQEDKSFYHYLPYTL